MVIQSNGAKRRVEDRKARGPGKRSAPKNAYSSARTADRVLDLLDVLAQEGGPLRVSEAAKKLGLPLSVVHRLFRSLLRAEYARQDENRKYLLGPAVSRLADRFFQTVDSRARYRELLEECRKLTGETSVLSVRQAANRVITDYVISTQTITCIPVLGESVSILTGATGRAFLSTQPPSEREALYRLNEIPAARRSELETLIAREKARGYFTSSSPTLQDLFGLAVPIPSSHGPAEAVVTIYCPEHRWTAKRTASVAAPLVKLIRNFVAMDTGVPKMKATTLVSESI